MRRAAFGCVSIGGAVEFPKGKLEQDHSQRGAILVGISFFYYVLACVAAETSSRRAWADGLGRAALKGDTMFQPTRLSKLRTRA
jgi:hypothetical protein